jgi:bifunctional non-homologous end joining protein LigD
MGQDYRWTWPSRRVPSQAEATVPACLEFSRAVSEAIAQTDPAAYTTKFAKAGRERKILIDYLRNNRTNTSVCAFSPRARPAATVSMPLDWKDLDEPPEHWTLVTLPQRLARLRRAPWKQYWATPQEISVSSLAAVGRAVRAR